MFVSERLLRRHVEHSNAIEHILVRHGAYVTSHLAAARYVAGHTKPFHPCDPNAIHRTLARWTEMHNHGGRWRARRIFVGGRECPKPQHVPHLMAWWKTCVREYLGVPQREAASRAETLHDLLLCIHPYRDGNGRTARLMLNSLRLARGLPWLAADATRRPAYHARIKRMHAALENLHPELY